MLAVPLQLILFENNRSWNNYYYFLYCFFRNFRKLTESALDIVFLLDFEKKERMNKSYETKSRLNSDSGLALYTGGGMTEVKVPVLPTVSLNLIICKSTSKDLHVQIYMYTLSCLIFIFFTWQKPGFEAFHVWDTIERELPATNKQMGKECRFVFVFYRLRFRKILWNCI